VSYTKNAKAEFKIDFLGIGAEKAGTTWLADCLREHPEVFIPKKKEVYFFNRFDPHYLKVKNPKYGWGIGWYKEQFDERNGRGKVKGELSPTYLYCRAAAKRIKKYFPGVKLLVVLRDPVERAFSQYIQDKRFGLVDNLTFGQAVEKYDNYIEKGFYFKHIKNYLEYFPKKNIKVIFLEDIKKKPFETLQEVYRFLALDDKTFRPVSLEKKTNEAKMAKFVLLNKVMISTEYWLREKGFSWVLRPIEKTGIRSAAIFIREMNTQNYRSYPKISREVERRLREAFSEDVGKLEKLLGVDLYLWKK
jgi:hypothetical protein